MNNELLSLIFAEPEKLSSVNMEICFSDMKCNMNCNYCFANHSTRKFTNSMSLNKDELAKQFDKIRLPIGAIAIWGGEPLFNPNELKEVVSLIKEYFPDTRIDMMSNGILLPEWEDFLIKNTIYIGISHDGPGQKYRGEDFLNNDKHNKVIQHLYDAGLFNKFKTVMHSKNWEASKIIEYFLRYSDKIGRLIGNDRLFISPNNINKFLFKTETDIKNIVALGEWTANDLLKHLNDLDYLKRFYQQSDIFQLMQLLKSISAKEALPSNLARCNWQGLIAFTADGHRVPCHCFSEKFNVKKDISADTGLQETLSHCSGCRYVSICGGGCAALSVEERKYFCNYKKIYFDTIYNIFSNYRDLLLES